MDRGQDSTEFLGFLLDPILFWKNHVEFGGKFELDNFST